ncbi:MAG: imelysin family protein [Myxococcales bacterium]|nr:imelysin family protein [Myxococcales bacterium]
MRTRWLGLGALLGLGAAAGLGVSCDDPAAPAFSARRAELLEAVGPSVYRPAYQRFRDAVGRLEQAVADWDGQPAEASAVRAAFAEAMTAWQGAELFLAGPAGSSLVYVGGLDLRDSLYSWPTTNPCRVDQVLADAGYAATDYLQTSLVNTVGLDALGHLIHAEDGGNACPALVTLNSEGTWAALGDAVVFTRRAAFAGVLVSGLKATADALLTAWDPAGGDHGGALAAARGYDGQRDALDQVSWGLLYLDRQLKDLKLGLPLGLDPDCTTEACPEAVELAWGDLALGAVQANLQGARALFVGEHPGQPDRVGFDAVLRDEGAGDLAEQILAELDAAQAAAAAVQGPLADAVVSRRAQVEALHGAVQALTTTFKTRFVTVLNLTLPQEGAADND